jgi:hypothetical protein
MIGGAFMVATTLMAALAATAASVAPGGVRQHSVALKPDDQARRKVFTDRGFARGHSGRVWKP